MTDCLNLLLNNGDIIGMVVCPFTNVIGPWFYAFVVVMLQITIFIKYNNLLAPSVMGIIASVAMIGLLPQAMSSFPIFMLIGNIAATLYAVFTRYD